MSLISTRVTNVLDVNRLLVLRARYAQTVGAVGVAALNLEALALQMLARAHREERRQHDDNGASHGLAQVIEYAPAAVVA